jgi:hypothetical protein
LLLAQFAKEKQRAAQAATGANRPPAELARPRIIPHPVAGTIEFEHGQIVAKMGKRERRCERIISTEPCFAHSTRTEWLRRQSRALVESFAPGRRGIDPAKLLVLPI